LPKSESVCFIEDRFEIPLADQRSFDWMGWRRVVLKPILKAMKPSTQLSSSGYRYICSVPGIRSGHAIIEGTRIGVHDVISLLQTGESVESVVANCFPALTRAHVYECLAYYEDHRGEIDVLVSRQMQTNA